MSAIYDLIKGNEIYYAGEEHSVLQVARAMVERNIGAVPVLRGDELVGMFSERDIMKRVVAEGRDPGKTSVADVMTTDLQVVSPSDTIENCKLLMKQYGIRHLPLCEGKKLKGIISLRDILLHEVNEMDEEVRAMRAYIQTT